MEEYAVKAKVGFSNMHYIVEAEDFEKALTKAKRYAIMLNNDVNITDLSVTRLWLPCPFCMTEMISLVGCPNIKCIGKKLIRPTGYAEKE